VAYRGEGEDGTELPVAIRFAFTTASPERREKEEPVLRSNLDKVKCRKKIARVLMFDHNMPPIHPLSRVI
jgi:hypothetical protein